MNSENLHEHECAHLSCGCAVEKEGDFCSDWCKRAIDSTDCGCGHADCRAAA